RTSRVQSADRGAGRWRAARAKASPRLFLGEPGLTDAKVVPLMLAPSSAAQRAHEPNDWNWPNADLKGALMRVRYERTPIAGAWPSASDPKAHMTGAGLVVGEGPMI